MGTDIRYAFTELWCALPFTCSDAENTYFDKIDEAEDILKQPHLELEDYQRVIHAVSEAIAALTKVGLHPDEKKIAEIIRESDSRFAASQLVHKALIDVIREQGRSPQTPEPEHLGTEEEPRC